MRQARPWDVLELAQVREGDANLTGKPAGEVFVAVARGLHMGVLPSNPHGDGLQEGVAAQASRAC